MAQVQWQVAKWVKDKAAAWVRFWASEWVGNCMTVCIQDQASAQVRDEAAVDQVSAICTALAHSPAANGHVHQYSGTTNSVAGHTPLSMPLDF